ncbi:hypothetical protein [Caulobacter rhizosphaerae]|jgi:hypothetical protein|uniref:Uncharacterized protein n=1 Tax=Caulobacter rhizosphaerae TaxID=2010972 RepID=A0ABU1N368_9CAUL|nr:hypothetical protein [Caulobacter rhizosphaerae]MDR6532900.1 hypothetical protein [Caulobacter rhizosphaerae]GGL48859.1 hypothetical protein GCM10010983_52730 [Caulobacter rhizosphaerae]
MWRLGLCLLGVTVLATAGPARAEDWKPSPGEAKTFYDADFMRVDQTSGLIVVRIAEGRPNGPYKAWPAGKGPIMVFALDCATDKWIDLGMDFTGDQGLPKGWRAGEKIEDIKGAAGGAGRVACETKDTLQKVALP